MTLYREREQLFGTAVYCAVSEFYGPAQHSTKIETDSSVVSVNQTPFSRRLGNVVSEQGRFPASYHSQQNVIT